MRPSHGVAAFAADRGAARIPRNPTPLDRIDLTLGQGRLPGSCRPHPRDGAGKRQLRASLNPHKDIDHDIAQPLFQEPPRRTTRHHP